MERPEFIRRVKFITKFGRVLHSVGSPAHTLESTMQEISRLLGLKGNFASLPTSITSSFSFEDEFVTKLDRVEPVGVNLGRLSSADLIAQKVMSGETSLEDGIVQLDDMMSSPEPYGKRFRVICYLISAGGFMVLFGGSWGDFLASIIVGILIGALALLRPVGVVGNLFEIIVAFVAGLGTYLLAKLFPGLNVGAIILSGLIVFMPGLVVTIAIAEIATQNLASGVARLVGGFMVLLQLAYGVFIGSKFASWFHFQPLNVDFGPIPFWLVTVTLPLTALMATVIFKAHRSDWIWVTLAGIYGYCCSKVGSYYLGPELGLFFGGACVGAGANLFARMMNRPSGIFQFPGIILLVPGSVGYRSLNFLFERNFVGGLDTAFTMVTLAMSLVVGVFVGNMFIRPRRSF
jgi:uncharacterized membrane protein YjjP (DUF1212 family)